MDPYDLMNIFSDPVHSASAIYMYGLHPCVCIDEIKRVNEMHKTLALLYRW